MTTPAYLPFFPADYLADTQHLSLEEHGAYLKLLMVAWRTTECSLADDDRRMAVMLGITTKKWASLKPAVMAFWTLDGGFWTQKRLTKTRNTVAAKAAVKAEAGAAGAASKWGDRGGKAQTRSERLAEARRKGRHTAEQWTTLVEVCGNKCVRCSDGGALVKDHITPIYQGGSDGIENVQPLCVRCNSSKGPEAIDFRPDDWAECLAKRLTDASLLKAQSSKTVLSPENQKKADNRELAFAGRVIRLRHEKYTEWRRTYHAIPDFAAELASIDEWLVDNPERQEKWVYQAKGSLNRRHQEWLAKGPISRRASADEVSMPC